ncbi:E3 ubiquitin- ligase DZIP3, partial [Paramuricea clavata]
SFMDGAAAESIAGLSLTNANYEEAIVILKSRFGNKQQIINRHMDIRLNLPSVNSENNLKGLRQLHDTVQSHIRSLKSMGVAPESYGSLLSSMLMSKLPTNLQLVVSRVVKENEWNLDKLLNTLQQKLEARERIKVPAINKDFKKYHGSVSALMAGTNPSCTYCRGSHPSKDCTTVTSPATRQDILRKTGRCFVCLRKDHISPNCKSTIRCYSCKGRHHVSICKGKKPPPPPPRDPPEGHGQRGSNKSKESPSLGTHPDATVCHTTSSNCVLLQTARANIYNPDNPNGPKVNARLILDGGSQCSYVSSALTGTLGLQSKGQRSVNIKTFGSSETNAQVVNLGIETSYGANIEMLAFTVPSICQPLKNQFVSNASKTYPHLANLHLADYSSGQHDAKITTNSKELQERICKTNQLVTVNNVPDGSNIARADILFQELCLAKGDWDHPLEGTLKCNWQKLVENLKEVQPVIIPRCYISDIHEQVVSYELHGFCDASIKAYAAVSPAKENIDNDVVPIECRIEMKVKDQRALDKETLSTMLVHGSKDSISNVINCKDDSSLGRLLRVSAVVLKFIKLLKSRVRQEYPPTNSEVTSSDIEFRISSSSMDQGTAGGNKVEREIQILEPRPRSVTDENGTVRCKGRLSNSNLPYSAKYPILLDTAHYLTTLIVRDCHERFRVKEAPPFTYVGLDYVGPLYVKSTNDLDEKAWICLITCCVSRAVHLEVVPNMTSQAFLRSFRRFTSRRATPLLVVSDNAKTCKDVSKELMTLMRDPQVKKYFLQQRMQWLFNLEKAPWWGGFFERLVGSLKQCLKKTIGKPRLSYDELVTAVTEAELILNSRPSSYVSSEDVEEPLTPAHLLSGRRILSLPDRHQENPEDEDFQVDLSTNDLNKRVRYLNDIIDHFWRRWRNEYLVELRNAHKSPKKTVEKSSVEVGDIVLVHDENHPRSFWRIGRIKELVNSTADGKSRGAVVQVMSKKGKVTTLRCPLQLLYLMEINCKLAKEEVQSEQENGAQESTESERLRRRAAIAGELLIRHWIKDMNQV